MTVLFTSTTLSPDLAQLVAWAVTEGLAWFLSLPPEGAMTTIGIGCFVVLASLFLIAEQGLSALVVWAMRR